MTPGSRRHNSLQLRKAWYWEHEASAARAQAENKAYQLPSARAHLLKVPGLPKTVPPAEEEGYFRFKI